MQSNLAMIAVVNPWFIVLLRGLEDILHVHNSECHNPWEVTDRVSFCNAVLVINGREMIRGPRLHEAFGGLNISKYRFLLNPRLNYIKDSHALDPDSQTSLLPGHTVL